MSVSCVHSSCDRDATERVDVTWPDEFADYLLTCDRHVDTVRP